MAIADQERRGGRHSANTRRKPASLSSTTRLASGDTQVAATHGFASCAMIRGLTLTCNILPRRTMLILLLVLTSFLTIRQTSRGNLWHLVPTTGHPSVPVKCCDLRQVLRSNLCSVFSHRLQCAQCAGCKAVPSEVVRYSFELSTALLEEQFFFMLSPASMPFTPLPTLCLSFCCLDPLPGSNPTALGIGSGSSRSHHFDPPRTHYSIYHTH